MLRSLFYAVLLTGGAVALTGLDNDALAQTRPPQDPKVVAPPNLVGTTWVGLETRAGYGRLEFRFKAKNQVEMIDADGSVMGKWQQSGNSVELVFYDGNCTYAGTITCLLGGTTRYFSPRRMMVKEYRKRR